MKTSTYLIVGAFVAGLAALGAVCYENFSNGVSRYDLTCQVDGEMVTTRLPDRFNRISMKVGYQTLNYDSETLRNFKGYIYEESDTATRAWLKAPAAWQRAIDTRVSNDTLYLVVDSHELLDSLRLDYFNRDLPVEVKQAGNLSWPVHIIAPRGKAKGVQNEHLSIRLQGLDRGFIKTEVGRALEIADCRIDTLRCASSFMNKLHLERSTVGLIHARQPRNQFKLSVSSRADSIGVLKVTGEHEYYRRMEIDNVNIGRLVWDATSPKAILNLSITGPMTIE